MRRQVRHEDIARRARELWQKYGHPVGRDEQIWLEAERQLRGLDLSRPPTTKPAAAPGQGHRGAPHAPADRTAVRV